MHETIEDNIKDVLSGDLLKNALDFVTYLRESGMTPDGNRFYYMGEMTCIIIWKKDKTNPSGEWFICDCPIHGQEGFPIDESVKEYAQANVSICRNCGCDHEARGVTKTIFGKEFNNLCSSEVIFVNPDAEGLEKIKMLMELWKHIIAESKKN